MSSSRNERSGPKDEHVAEDVVSSRASPWTPESGIGR